MTRGQWARQLPSETVWRLKSIARAPDAGKARRTTAASSESRKTKDREAFSAGIDLLSVVVGGDGLEPPTLSV